MRTIIVTGGLGRAGRWVVDRLADEEWHVVCVDLDHPGWEVEPRENVTFRAADLTDAGETFDLVGEVAPDAVAHLAAIPAPERHAGHRVFETNATSTYNVLQAAGRAGARVAWTSSESAYGFPFAEEPFLPDALPITEAHPLRPEDPYGVAKVAGEEVAKTVTRRHGVPVASIRPSWVQQPGEYNCLDAREELANGVGNFWSYVDARDLAGVVAAALDADFEGHEAFNAAAPDNYVGRPTADLVEEQFGELPEVCEVDGEASALSVAKAKERLGWEPEHTWREAGDADVTAPTLYER